MFIHRKLIGFHSVRRLKHLTFVATLVLYSSFCSLIAPHASADEDLSVFHDLRHTLLVRKALSQDRELAPLNLGAKVESRVAHVWGAVPSDRLMQKAIQLVQTVPEIVEVRSRLFVEEAETMPPLFLPPSPAEVKPAETNIQPAVGTPNSAVYDAAPPVNKTSAPSLPGASSPPSVTFQPRRKEAPLDDHGLFVLPPIAVPDLPDISVSLSPVVPKSLPDRIAELKNDEARYQYLDVLVQDQRVYLSGVAERWEDVHSLARTVAQLPDVKNVVIGQVRILSAN